MRIFSFAKRNFKELIRDPLSLVFAVILPLFLLFIFQQFNIPSDNYRLENFTPGIIIFSFSFITMFSAMLISKDRSTSLLMRLGVSPMKPIEYILGYTISLVPIVVIENILLFTLAIILELDFSINIVFAILISLIISILFIALGILIGSLFTEKASSGISSIIVQLVCFTSGMYFSSDMLGKFFSTLCKYLPFESSLTIIKGIMNGNLGSITYRNIIVFAIYTLLTLVLSMKVFKTNMVSDNKQT